MTRFKWQENKRYVSDPDQKNFQVEFGGIQFFLDHIHGDWSVNCPFLHIFNKKLDAKDLLQAQDEVEIIAIDKAQSQMRTLRKFIRGNSK